MTPEMVLLGLGSNLGPRREHLAVARLELESFDDFQLVAASSLWETAAWGGPDGQEPFLNCALLFTTECGDPRELLRRMHAIEAMRGRVRKVRNGPRSLDLDLLLFGQRVSSDPDLQLPHPGIPDRPFVLVPAAEIGPQLLHPVHGITLAELLAKAGQDGVLGKASGPDWGLHVFGAPQNS